MNKTITILEVKQVSGNTLNKNWKLPMQIVTTNLGDFIDTAPRTSYNYKRPTQKDGYNWEQLVGKTLQSDEYIITPNSGYYWIKYNGLKD